MTRLEQCRVMVVEDEFYLAMDVAKALRRGGADVVGPFPSKDEALTALQDQRPDCVIVDVNLGEGPAFELADQLRARGVKFLFFTGYDRAAIPTRFTDVIRLEKPVDDDRLILAARKVCNSVNMENDI